MERILISDFKTKKQSLLRTTFQTERCFLEGKEPGWGQGLGVQRGEGYGGTRLNK